MASSAAIDTLTGLRAYAALWVVLSHALYTDSFSLAVAERADWLPLRGILQHEYLAVDLFFVLSGFVLTLVHAREFDGALTKRPYVKFLLLRLARVYPLHLLGLAGAIAVGQLVPSSAANSAGSFILQLLLMSSWGFCSGLSWNGPAWSLSSEWLAYLVLPLMILISAGVRRVRSQLLALGVITSLFGFVFYGFHQFPQLFFPLDMSNGAGASTRVLCGVAIGSVLRRLYDQPRVRQLPWTTISWLAFPLWLATMTGLHGERYGNNIFSYSMTVFIVFAVACASPRAHPLLSTRLPKYLGEISFAVYIFHAPALTFMGWLFRERLALLATNGSLAEARLAVVGAVVAVGLVGAVANRYVEKPLRNRLRRWIDRRYPHEAGATTEISMPSRRPSAALVAALPKARVAESQPSPSVGQEQRYR